MLLKCCCHRAGLSRWLHHLPLTALISARATETEFPSSLQLRGGWWCCGRFLKKNAHTAVGQPSSSKTWSSVPGGPQLNCSPWCFSLQWWVDGSSLPDLADVRAFPGAGGCQLCEWPAELSITGAEGEAGCTQGQVLLVPPTGDRGTHQQWFKTEHILFEFDNYTLPSLCCKMYCVLNATEVICLFLGLIQPNKILFCGNSTFSSTNRLVDGEISLHAPLDLLHSSWWS